MDKLYTVVEQTTEHNQTLHVWEPRLSSNAGYYLQTKTIWFVVDSDGIMRGGFSKLSGAFHSVMERLREIDRRATQRRLLSEYYANMLNQEAGVNI